MNASTRPQGELPPPIAPSIEGIPTDIPSLFETVKRINTEHGEITPKEYYHFLKVFHTKENAEWISKTDQVMLESYLKLIRIEKNIPSWGTLFNQIFDTEYPNEYTCLSDDFQYLGNNFYLDTLFENRILNGKIVPVPTYCKNYDDEIPLKSLHDTLGWDLFFDEYPIRDFTTRGITDAYTKAKARREVGNYRIKITLSYGSLEVKFF